MLAPPCKPLVSVIKYYVMGNNIVELTLFQYLQFIDLWHLWKLYRVSLHPLNLSHFNISVSIFSFNFPGNMWLDAHFLEIFWYIFIKKAYLINTD